MAFVQSCILIMGTVFGAFLFVFWLVIVLAGLHKNVLQGDFKNHWKHSGWLPKSSLLEGDESESLAQSKLLKATPLSNRIAFEITLKLLTAVLGTCISLLSLWLTDSPTWAMALLPMIAMRSKSIDAALCEKTWLQLLEADFKTMKFPFLSSMGVGIAEYQHGVVMANAFWEDDIIAPQFALGWCKISSPTMCSIMTFFHLYGMLACTMIMCSLFQYGTLAASPVSTSAKIAGFGALANALRPVSIGERCGLSVNVFLMSLLTVQPYLFWQTSLYMALGGQSVTTAVSIVLSSALAMGSVWDMFSAILILKKSERTVDLLTLLTCFIGVGAVCVTVLMMVRGVKAHECLGEWGVASGCVNAGLNTTSMTNMTSTF